MSYKQCPFCGEKNIQRGYGTGVDKITSYWVKPLPEEDLTVMKRQLDSWQF